MLDMAGQSQQLMRDSSCYPREMGFGYVSCRDDLLLASTRTPHRGQYGRRLHVYTLQLTTSEALGTRNGLARTEYGEYCST